MEESFGVRRADVECCLALHLKPARLQVLALFVHSSDTETSLHIASSQEIDAEACASNTSNSAQHWQQ